MSAHHCHANGCAELTPPRLFMCPRHWAMVPQSLRHAVWDTYRAAPGRHLRVRSIPYMQACANAVEYVARLEGKPEANSYRRVCATLATMQGATA